MREEEGGREGGEEGVREREARGRERGGEGERTRAQHARRETPFRDKETLMRLANTPRRVTPSRQKENWDSIRRKMAA